MNALQKARRSWSFDWITDIRRKRQIIENRWGFDHLPPVTIEAINQLVTVLQAYYDTPVEGDEWNVVGAIDAVLKSPGTVNVRIMIHHCTTDGSGYLCTNRLEMYRDDQLIDQLMVVRANLEGCRVIVRMDRGVVTVTVVPVIGMGELNDLAYALSQVGKYPDQRERVKALIECIEVDYKFRIIMPEITVDEWILMEDRRSIMDRLYGPKFKDGVKVHYANNTLAIRPVGM